MRKVTHSFLFAAFAALTSSLLSGQSGATAPPARHDTATGAAFDFTIRNIMRGPELYGRVPSQVAWSADSRWIYFMWTPAGADFREHLAPYRVRAVAGAKPERLSLAAADSAGPYTSDPVLSADRARGVIEFGGDLFVSDVRRGTVRRLTHTIARESNAVFGADGRTIYFSRDGNAFSIDIASGLTTQLTDLRTGVEPVDTVSKNPQKVRLMAQQRDLFEVVRDHLADDSTQKADRVQLDSIRNPHTIWLGRDRTPFAAHVSPDGRGVVVLLRTPSRATQTEIPFWVTESGYTDPRKGRTKVGDAEARTEMVYISLPSNKLTHLHLFPADSLMNFASFNGWNASGGNGLIFARSADNKQRILYSISSGDGALHQIESLKDTAWVGGPCGQCAGWYDEGRRVWYVSEKSGFAHLYSATADGSDTRALTSGKWEVRAVDMSQDGRTFYLTTNDPSPTDERLFSLPAAGGTLTPITDARGKHSASVSPDGKLVADVWSNVNVPPDLYVMPNRPGNVESRLTHSPSDEFARGPWIVPHLVMVPASDGAQVPAHVYLPSDLGAKPNGAAVIFVHGAGYLQNVGNFWKEAYPREYMFNHYLAAHGYVVIDADYRASDGYGRDWRTAIYRYMGGRDLEDEVDVSKYLTATYHIPPARIGMYGGSYGGFMTLMALFTRPDYFGAGAAIRSVTDWAHYNNGYTSAILNSPQSDTLAYRRSSPIYFAEGLRAPLLMLHGMVDTNVHYEDIVRLEERLIELGKTNWSLASYPVEDHGFVRPTSWTDEYTRIFNLFETTIAKQ